MAIVKSYSLVAACRAFGKPSLEEREFINSKTQEPFTRKSICFTHPTEVNEDGQPKKTWAMLSKSLADYTAADIIANPNALNVVELEDGYLRLAKAGSIGEELAIAY